MTPKAVPCPAVANEPVLQMVKTVEESPTNDAPCEPIARFIAKSSASIATASANTRSNDWSCNPPMRSNAQNKLTAVGLEAVSPARASVMFAPPFAAKAMPYAAATPIAGAPRTAMSRTASRTCSHVVNTSHFSLRGNVRWSSMCNAPLRHSIGLIAIRLIVPGADRVTMPQCACSCSKTT